MLSGLPTGSWGGGCPAYTEWVEADGGLVGIWARPEAFCFLVGQSCLGRTGYLGFPLPASQLLLITNQRPTTSTRLVSSQVLPSWWAGLLAS